MSRPTAEERLATVKRHERESNHYWFDCELPTVIETFGETANCTSCGREWTATEAGWRNAEEGTVLTGADMSKAKYREPAQGSEALPDGIQRMPGRKPRGG